MKNSKSKRLSKSIIFLVLFLTTFYSQAQDFDKEFLESLPEDVRKDLLEKKSKQEDLEKDRYRRPSSYIEKEDYRKQIIDLKRQLDRLENDLEESDDQDISERFGTKVFSLMQTTFMPFNEPNFDGNYILDFGDVLEIQMVGQKSQSITAPIKRDGSINIPDVGKLYLSGLKLDNAVNIISNKIKTIFTGVDVFTSLVSVRDIQIIVSGNVFNPGPYTLNGNSTLFHALAVSGGPSETGSFRKIELVRGNKIIETADLYDTFIHGKSSFSTRLRSGDLIFISPVINLVSISGAVNRPGTYELKEDENLSSVIMFANGINNRADFSEISLIRLEDGSVNKIAINDPLDFETILSNDKDKIIVRNYPYRSVEILGAVKNPGKYLLNEGSGIYDIVTIAGGYTKNAYPFGGVLENIQTKKINEMAADKLYETFIDELSRVSSNPTVTPPDMTFLAEIINEIKNTKASGRVSAEFDLEILKNDQAKDILLQEGDVVTIPEFLDHVYIFGEINTEGTVRYEEGASVNYYIEKKGGTSPYSNKKNIYILHANGETSLVKYKRNIFMKGNKKVELYPGSIIFIPRETGKVPFSVAAQAYASILGNIGVSLASVSVLKD